MVNRNSFAQHRITLHGTGIRSLTYIFTTMLRHHAGIKLHVPLTFCLASTSARSSISAFAVSRWPSCEAMCSGVQSSCTGGDAECRRVGVSVPLFPFLIHASCTFILATIPPPLYYFCGTAQMLSGDIQNDVSTLWSRWHGQDFNSNSCSTSTCASCLS
jgi:hypothetical protein